MARILISLGAVLIASSLLVSFAESRSYDGYSRLRKREINVKSCLDRINGYRKQHDAEPLKWDSYTVNHAKEWAEILVASGGKLAKDLQEKYGEREGELLYRGTSCEQAVDAWYSEIGKYRASGACEKPPRVAPEGTEDFAQLVWRSSQRVGVAIIGDLIVARFHPPGNFVDEYADDVKC